MTYRELINQFQMTYGDNGEKIRLFEAPGRINLLGEHTDYNGGHILSVAIRKRSIVAARVRLDELIKLSAVNSAERVTASVKTLGNYRNHPFGNYELGVAYSMQEEGFNVPGCELLYNCEIPICAGFSAGSAIELSTAYALSALSNEHIDPLHAALLCKKSENQFVGVGSGLHQFAAALSKKGQATLLDCRTLTYERIPLNLDGIKLVSIHTNRICDELKSLYTLRLKECREAIQMLNTRHREIDALSELTMDELEERKIRLTDEVLHRRARYVIGENLRVQRGAIALQEGDAQMLGTLLNASHESLRDDYEVVDPQIDALCDKGRSFEGVLGMRMIGVCGCGRGYAIVREDVAEDFIEWITQMTKDDAVVEVVESADSAHEVFDID